MEFLDYFFLKDATLEDKIDGNDWWHKLDEDGKPVQEKKTKDRKPNGDLSDESEEGFNEATLRKR